MKIKLKFLLITFIALIQCFCLAAQKLYTDQLKVDAAQWIGAPVTELKEICGGMTNISFLVTTEKNQFVVRIGKKDSDIFGIDRFCEVVCQRRASELGIAPKVIYSNPGDGTLVSSFIIGKTLSGEDICEESKFEKVVQLVKKCHSISFKKEFKTPLIYEKVRKMIRASTTYESSFILSEEAKKTIEIVNKIELYFREKEKKYEGLCHCDLFPRNFMDDGSQLWLIDWEYACWGNILYDLASLSIELDLSEQKNKDLLKLYFGSTWQENYFDFQLMHALYNLRNAFWYDLRGMELRSIGEFNMADWAKKHFERFSLALKELLPNLQQSS